MTTRRRFLTLAAAALGAPAAAGPAGPVRWRGTALGAQAALEVHGGPPGAARAALRDAVAEMQRLERVFSLHAPGSALSHLNREGGLPEETEGAADLALLLRRSHVVFERSNGLFNPFVQPLWRALAEGRTPRGAERLLDFPPPPGPDHDPEPRLGAGQALTFNGIAQGHIADRVAERLAAHGFDRALVDTGEIRGVGGPWRIGLADPGLGRHGWATLRGGALATSSPGAMTLADGGSHIVAAGGRRRPAWSSVTVEAADATRADAASTALALTRDRDEAATLAAALGLGRVIVVDRGGDVTTLRDARPAPAAD